MNNFRKEIGHKKIFNITLVGFVLLTMLTAGLFILFNKIYLPHEFGNEQLPFTAWTIPSDEYRYCNENGRNYFKYYDQENDKWLCSSYFLKENKIYGYSHRSEEDIVNADLDTFLPIAYDYAVDKYRAFSKTDQLIGTDPFTFRHIPYSYGLDNNSVYFYNHEILDADPFTFTVFSGDEFVSRDKNYVYYFGEKIPGSDPETFEILNTSYQKDKNQVYYMFEVIEGADPGTFEILERGEFYNARDMNREYSGGIIREKRSVIRRFVDNYLFKRGYWDCDELHYEDGLELLDLNNDDGNIIIDVKYYLPQILCCPEPDISSCPNHTQKIRNLFVDLEQELKSNFSVVQSLSVRMFDTYVYKSEGL